MNMEATFSALKGYIDCEISILNGKVDLFIESLKEAVERTLWKKELLAKNNIIKSLLKTQEVALETLMNCKKTSKININSQNIPFKQQIQQYHKGFQNNQQKVSKKPYPTAESTSSIWKSEPQQQLQTEREQQQEGGKEQQQLKLKHQTRQQQH